MEMCCLVLKEFENYISQIPNFNTLRLLTMHYYKQPTNKPNCQPNPPTKSDVTNKQTRKPYAESNSMTYRASKTILIKKESIRAVLKEIDG